MAWMICREGDAEPEYFAGTLFSAGENWTCNPDRAFQYIRRSAARSAMLSHGMAADPLVRIVPVFVPKESGPCSPATRR